MLWMARKHSPLNLLKSDSQVAQVTPLIPKSVALASGYVPVTTSTTFAACRLCMFNPQN